MRRHLRLLLLHHKGVCLSHSYIHFAYLLLYKYKNIYEEHVSRWCLLSSILVLTSVGAPSIKCCYAICECTGDHQCFERTSKACVMFGQACTWLWAGTPPPSIAQIRVPNEDATSFRRFIRLDIQGSSSSSFLVELFAYASSSPWFSSGSMNYSMNSVWFGFPWALSEDLLNLPLNRSIHIVFCSHLRRNSRLHKSLVFLYLNEPTSSIIKFVPHCSSLLSSVDPPHNGTPPWIMGL